MRKALVFAIFAGVTVAAPKVKPTYPDVVVGKEFLLPWPPVEVYPPAYELRIVEVGPLGVDVRRLNGPVAARLVIDHGTGNAYCVDLDSDHALPTVPEVQALISLRHRPRDR